MGRWAGLRLGGYTATAIVAWLVAHTLLVDTEAARPAVVGPPRIIERPARDPGDVSVLFLGDTGQTADSEGVLRERGYRWALGPTVELVRSADLAVANLEVPITTGGDPSPLWKGYRYTSPPEWAEALGWAGLDVATLANNHALDAGPIGLGDTQRLLALQHIATAGAGGSSAEARAGLVVRVGGVRIGILAYLERQFAFSAYEVSFAGARRAGVAALDEEALAADIARLRPLVDVLFVSVHWGDNYAPPTGSVLRWGRRAIDLGADAVIGHHPHVAHPVLAHRGRPVLLSLGNYTFGTPGHPQLDWGLLAFAHVVDRRLDRIELVPIDVQNRRVRFQPVPLEGQELDAALAALAEGSQSFGARLRISAGRAIVSGQDSEPGR